MNDYVLLLASSKRLTLLSLVLHEMSVLSDKIYINDLVQDCSISIANALKMVQSCKAIV